MDIKRRQEAFGKHTIALPEIEPFFNLLSRNFEDINVIFLIWAATIYLVFSMFSRSETAYIESLTIYSGLLFSALISSFCDWVKERQYLKLRDEINNQVITVYRGAHGTVQQIPVRDVVVGDVVDLKQGDRVPADCLLIEEMNIKVDQSMYFTGQTVVEKEESRRYHLNGKVVDNHKEHPDPFLFTNTKIMCGQGKGLVLAVGQNTLLARMRKPGHLKLQEQFTELERKLEKTANMISKYALLATILTVLTHLIFLIICYVFTGQSYFSNTFLLQVLKIGIVAMVLMIVAIPEGLPLAISVAMALSINRLKKDEILIKNIESIQTAAMLHELIVGKTGILTKGDLNVAKFQIGDGFNLVHDHKRDEHPDFFSNHVELDQNHKDFIVECLLNNTDVRFETNDKEFKYEPHG